MKINLLNLRNSINKAYLKVKPNRTEIEVFKKNITNLFDQIKESESEEFHKNIISEFLKNTYYSPHHYINTKGRADLVIHTGKDTSSNVGVLFETKKPGNKPDMPTANNINSRAFHELILYFMRERIKSNNLEIKNLIITNVFEWFIINATDFEKHFASDKNFVKQFIDFEEGRLSGTNTDFFYKNIAQPFVENIDSEISVTHFDIRDFETIIKNADTRDDNKLIALYKIFSPEHLLKIPFTNDSNNLDKTFYNELLHIIGLEETKDGSKKLIGRKKTEKRNQASLIENSITILKSEDCLNQLQRRSDFGKDPEEQFFNVALELTITWINRILFLKLLEGQLVRYNGGDKTFRFLDTGRVHDYDELNKLFFQVLAVNESDRNERIKEKFGNIPYLNSSLFEPADLEHKTIRISNLDDHFKLPLLSNTVLKDKTGKKLTGELNPIQYLLEFLDAYDFSSEGSEDIQEENKTLINASVLGLIFEKINGYKDGSFFTPGFITMYMCHETIRRAVVQKFNEAKGWSCETINNVYNKIEDIEEANIIIDSLKICDPAVGSGHFLVSALNEIIAIKSELKILSDKDGKRLKEYTVEVINDELIITDEQSNLFGYNPKSKESQRVQEALFHEKQKIIENCLFGVDINPNSVKICRLRLWIELLKNAFYKPGTLNRELETLPNIDINIKCGNSLISRYSLDADIKTALKSSRWNVDNYREAIMTYRNAQSKDEKRSMEQLISKIKNDFETEVSKSDKRYKKLNILNGELLGLTSQSSLFELSKTQKEEWNKKVKKLTVEIQNLESQITEIKSNKIYENAFEWRFEFPEVLNSDGDFVGFDVVIGNPPWGAELSKNQKEYLKSTFLMIDSSTPNTFAYFVGLSIKIGKGLITQILPDSLLVKDYPKTRQLLRPIISKINWYQNTGIPEVYRPFLDVEHDVCTLFFDKNKSFESCSIGKRFYENYMLIDNNNIMKKSDFIIEEYEFTFNLLLTDLDFSIIGRLKNCILLESILQCHEGIHSGNIRDKIFSRENNSDSKKSMFLGAKNGDIIDNYLSFTSGWFVDYNEDLIDKKSGEYASLRDQKIFDLPKIYITRTGNPFKAFIDETNYASNNFFSIQFKNYEINSITNLIPVLGLLNSSFANYFIRKIVAPSLGNTFIETKIIHLLKLPLPSDLFDSILLIDKVNQILLAKKSSPNADTSTLEAEIDRLVYELYRLTEEEIRIVEKNEK
jgi:adenine-specific DNA-methyltransferase